MTSSTQYGCGSNYVDPDAPSTYTRSTQVADGVYLTTRITGEQQLTDIGDTVHEALGSIVAEQVNDLASSRYVFTHSVSRTTTVLDGDDEYTVTVDFTPSRRRDLRNGKSEISVLNALDRAVALVHQTITAQATVGELLQNLGPLGAVFAMAMG
jgi:hypothetical protein